MFQFVATNVSPDFIRVAKPQQQTSFQRKGESVTDIFTKGTYSSCPDPSKLEGKTKLETSVTDVRGPCP